MELAAISGLELKQLNYWLTNVRKRVWGPLRKERDMRLPSNADRMRTMARHRLMDVPTPGIPPTTSISGQSHHGTVPPGLPNGQSPRVPSGIQPPPPHAAHDGAAPRMPLYGPSASIPAAPPRPPASLPIAGAPRPMHPRLAPAASWGLTPASVSPPGGFHHHHQFYQQQQQQLHHHHALSAGSAVHQPAYTFQFAPHLFQPAAQPPLTASLVPISASTAGTVLPGPWDQWRGQHRPGPLSQLSAGAASEAFTPRMILRDATAASSSALSAEPGGTPVLISSAGAAEPGALPALPSSGLSILSADCAGMPVPDPTLELAEPYQTELGSSPGPHRPAAPLAAAALRPPDRPGDGRGPAPPAVLTAPGPLSGAPSAPLGGPSPGDATPAEPYAAGEGASKGSAALAAAGSEAAYRLCSALSASSELGLSIGRLTPGAFPVQPLRRNGGRQAEPIAVASLAKRAALNAVTTSVGDDDDDDDGLPAGASARSHARAAAAAAAVAPGPADAPRRLHQQGPLGALANGKRPRGSDTPAALSAIGGGRAPGSPGRVACETSAAPAGLAGGSAEVLRSSRSDPGIPFLSAAAIARRAIFAAQAAAGSTPPSLGCSPRAAPAPSAALQRGPRSGAPASSRGPTGTAPPVAPAPAGLEAARASYAAPRHAADGSQAWLPALLMERLSRHDLLLSQQAGTVRALLAEVRHLAAQVQRLADATASQAPAPAPTPPSAPTSTASGALTQASAPPPAAAAGDPSALPPGQVTAPLSRPDDAAASALISLTAPRSLDPHSRKGSGMSSSSR